MTETMNISTFKGAKQKLLAVYGKAEARYSAALAEYDLLLLQFGEHQALDQKDEGEKLKPEILELREEIAELELAIAMNSAEEIAELSREALADGLKQIHLCAERGQGLLADLEKVKVDYLAVVSEIGSNQRAAAGVAGLISQINRDLPEDGRKAVIPSWRAAHAWNLDIAEDACRDALGFPAIWPFS